MTEVVRDTAVLNGGLLSPSRLGDVNRSRVLQTICDNGPLARADLARLAGVARATIGNIVQSLIDAGLLEEGEPRETGHVGKPARPVWFTREAGLCAAVHVDVERVRAAVVNFRGDLLTEQTVELEPGEGVEAVVVDALETVLRDVPGVVDGIGVAVPGVVDTDTGSVLQSSHLRGLDGLALGPDLSKRFGLPTLVDNDSRAQALAEKWFGAGRGLPTFASVQTGEGLSVGMVLSGVLHRGAHGGTGELGHTTVVLDGEKCWCGRRGCWETVATLGWLRRAARERRVTGARKAGCASLTAAAEEGVAGAAELLADYADHLAVGLATLVHLVGPPRIVLHGDVLGGGESFRLLLQDRLDAQLLPHLRGTAELVPSPLDRRAGLLGAAGLVLSETYRLVA